MSKKLKNEKLKDNKKYSFVKVLFRIVSIQYKSIPFHNTMNILISMFHAITWTLGIIATKILFDAITDAAAGKIGFQGCVISLLLLAAATFGQQIMNGVHNFYATVLEAKSKGRIRMLLQRKLQRIAPASFEDTEFLDDLNKAREAVNAIPMFCGILYMLVSFYVVFFATTGAYLFSLKPLLLLILVLAFVPALLGQIVRAKVFTKLEQQSAPLRREYEYYQKTLCDREYFKETRILGAFNFFHKLFDETMRLFSLKQWRAERNTCLLQLVLSLTTFGGMAVSSYILFSATMLGEITVGAFAAVFNALATIFNIMQEIVGMHLGRMNKDLGKVTNYIRMLDLPERIGEAGTPDFTKGITLENVSFTYPGREEPAVKGVSLCIKNGETIAIVGENGAGKSTLVRLLTGIYCPSSGKATMGGLNTISIDPASIYEKTSGVFQKYQRYKMTLHENVGISDTVKGSGKAGIEIAIKNAGAEIEGVALGDMLSPEFDGIDLSGGQWQRLAIARGLYRVNGFIVLDEPTAAIDPIEETRVYTQFQQLALGKCAVVVTHRLGSAKLAHRIIVMDAGKIIDTGTHEQLVSRPGKYADMWAAQAQWYERSDEA